MESLILMILVCLLLAFIFSELFTKLGLPRVVGQICAGLFLGVGFIRDFLFTSENLSVLNFLANLGIILLFYYIGMESNLKIFSKNIKNSLVISVFKTVFPFISGFFVSRYLLGFGDVSSLFIAVFLAAGAQSVSVDILEELNILKSKLGNTIISVGIITDIIEFAIMTILLSVLQISSSNLSILNFIFYLVLFVSFLIFARFFMIKYILKIFDREHSSTARFTAALIILLIIVSLTEFLSIGALIGALAAGLVIRQTIYKDINIPNFEERDMAKSIHIIAFGFLIPLFFVWVGLNTDVLSVFDNLLNVSVFTLVALVSILGGVVLAVLFLKGSFKEGIILGFGLSPKGDIGFVLGALALENGIINDQVFSSLVVMALFITLISPICFKYFVSKDISDDKSISRS